VTSHITWYSLVKAFLSAPLNISAYVLLEMHRAALEKMATCLRGAREGGVI
jgi:hypothetical protein